VRKQTLNQGRSLKLYAENLGGRDFISCNLYVTSKGVRIKPCEMALEKVLDFLT
jgi:peptide-methionine (S)-S-oxide reductase